jgi:hypothetical protein
VSAKYEGEGSRPVPIHETARLRRDFLHERFSHHDGAHQNQKGLRFWATLDHEDAPDRVGLPGVGSEPVEGLGGKRHDSPPAEHFRPVGDELRRRSLDVEVKDSG